jgi:hypothetical protein
MSGRVVLNITASTGRVVLSLKGETTQPPTAPLFTKSALVQMWAGPSKPPAVARTVG